MLAMTAIRRGRSRGGAAYYSAGVPPDLPVPSPDAPAAEAAVPPRPPRRRISVNTAIFSIGTGLSRVAGLVREILASSFFGTSGAFSAFTIAFQIPNLLRQLVADYAVSAAFEAPSLTWELATKVEPPSVEKVAQNWASSLGMPSV